MTRLSALFPALLGSLFVLLLSFPALAGGSLPPPPAGWADGAVLGVFVLAYGIVLLEERLSLRKSKPVTIAAGLIWILVIVAYDQAGRAQEAITHLRHSLLEYAEMMLFLLSAMTYVNSLEERGLFEALRVRLVAARLSLRGLFWVCGGLAFVLSPIADNLTTALILGSVALAVGRNKPAFVAASCVNIVVAANAGGAFSPFGDITTLMVWQKGVVPFTGFFALFLPALVSWLVPAFALSLAVGNKAPHIPHEKITVRRGGFVIAGLFLFTITLTVVLHNTLHVPPFLGMMTGLGLLKLYGYFIKREELKNLPEEEADPRRMPFNIFVSLKRVEWDTLMFFYGVILCVGGLSAMGHLDILSRTLYGDLGATTTHILIGLLSALIDNIPVMFAVLSMDQAMSQGQWLLVTLTAGIGGSLLSIGSAAGVALMGQARGSYTFLSHLKWSWAILLGYLAGVGTHLLLNADLF